MFRHLFQELRARITLLEMMLIRHEVRDLMRIPFRFTCESGKSERKLMNTDTRQAHDLGRNLRKVKARSIKQFFELERADIRSLAPRCEYDALFAYFPVLECEQKSDGEKGKEKDNKSEHHTLFDREPFEAHDDYFLSEFLHGGINESADGDTRIFHERLLKQHAVAQITIHLAFNGLGACRLGDLGGFFRKNFPRGLEVALFDIITRRKLRTHRGDMHRDIVREFGELFVLGYEISLAAEHHGSYDSPARMRICRGDARTERPVGFLGGDGGALFAQDDFCLFDISARFFKRLFALHDSDTGLVPQPLNHVRCDFHIKKSL